MLDQCTLFCFPLTHPNPSIIQASRRSLKISTVGSSSPQTKPAVSRRPTMTVFADLVSDPSLLPVLETSAEAHRECQKLIDLLDPSDAARDDPSAAEQRRAAISRQQKTVYALLAKLRGLNRDAILRVRETKQATAEARQEIDRLHLQLQNLYYEQRHLMSEIAACESYECVHPFLLFDFSCG